MADHAGIGAHIGEEHGRLDAGALEHPLGALGNLPAAGRDGIQLLAHGPEQRGVSNGRADGVRVRILVADDVEWRGHEEVGWQPDSWHGEIQARDGGVFMRWGMRRIAHS